MRKTVLATLALTAIFTLGFAAPAQAEEISLDYTIVATDPSSDLGPGSDCTSYGIPGFLFTTRQFSVNADGAYTFISSTDGFFGLYSQPYDAANPLAGCIVSSNSTSSSLTAGTAYWLYLSTVGANATGNFQLAISGPGEIAVGLPSITTVAASPAPAPAGTEVALTATVSGITPTGTVEFFAGVASLGASTLANGQATLATSTLAPGDHSIIAVYSGDATNARSTSDAVTVTITALAVESAPAATLPDAGAEALPLGLAALALLAAGAAALATRRITRVDHRSEQAS